jgi:hypothetical protein
MAIPTRADVDAMVRDKLATDPDFRAALLADPHAALSALVGMTIPDTVTINVHEQSLTDIHLVIPQQSAPAGELNEEDLELVAGGGACWDNCNCGV